MWNYPSLNTSNKTQSFDENNLIWTNINNNKLEPIFVPIILEITDQVQNNLIVLTKITLRQNGLLLLHIFATQYDSTQNLRMWKFSTQKIIYQWINGENLYSLQKFFVHNLWCTNYSHEK